MKISLPYEFVPRDYQTPLWDAALHEDFLRGIIVIPRRNGKDLTCWNIMIAKAMQRVGLYFYIAPYYNQARQIIWDGVTGDGRKFLDYIPPALITNKTKLDMRIELINGSVIKLHGSDNIDRIVGTNPIGVIFTEFSLHKPEAWNYIRPILAENGGWALFNGTPRSFNHFYDLYNFAKTNDGWFNQHLDRDQTGVPSLAAIEEDRISGMPEELIKQEYYCSFEAGNVGSYYGSAIEKLRNTGRITTVSYEPMLPVYTSWDLGIGDANAIWFFQLWGKEVRVIDYFEDEGEGLPYYIKYVREKPYVYEEHFAPHDIVVRDYGSGRSRYDVARDLGIDFTIVPKLSIDDGIEATRNLLPRCWFEENKTLEGLNALINYSKRYDAAHKTFSNKPLHNWASNGADAFRMFAVMIDEIVGDGSNQDAPKVVRALR